MELSKEAKKSGLQALIRIDEQENPFPVYPYFDLLGSIGLPDDYIGEIHDLVVDVEVACDKGLTLLDYLQGHAATSIYIPGKVQENEFILRSIPCPTTQALEDNTEFLGKIYSILNQFTDHCYQNPDRERTPLDNKFLHLAYIGATEIEMIKCERDLRLLQSVFGATQITPLNSYLQLQKGAKAMGLGSPQELIRELTGNANNNGIKVTKEKSRLLTNYHQKLTTDAEREDYAFKLENNVPTIRSI